jgi:hypothetical protein
MQFAAGKFRENLEHLLYDTCRIQPVFSSQKRLRPLFDEPVGDTDAMRTEVADA